MNINVKSFLPKPALAFLLLALGACGPFLSTEEGKVNKAPGSTGTTPTVLSTTPATGGTGVFLNGSISATFSEPMAPASLTGGTFTIVSESSSIPFVGTVIYTESMVSFWPGSLLASNTMYTATVTTGAKSAAGMPLAKNYAWSFTTGALMAPGAPVKLATARTFAILAKSGISTVPASVITGNIGVSPAAASYLTGFSLIADATNVFSASTQIVGQAFAADYESPTPANLTTAVLDMELAFTDAAGRAPNVTELGAGDIGGLTLIPGVYKWGTGLLIPTDVTLTGSATDIWIFQIAQGLTMAGAKNVYLSGGALAKNVFWQVSGAVEIGTTSHFEGIILSQTAIALRTGASINGRLLAQTAVVLDSSTVAEPAP